MPCVAANNADLYPSLNQNFDQPYKFSEIPFDPPILENDYDSQFYSNKNPSKKYPSDFKQEIVTKLVEGCSFNEVHEAHGIPLSTLWGWNRLANPRKTRKCNNYPPDFKQKILASLSKNYPFNALHKVYNIPLSTLRRWKDDLHKKTPSTNDHLNFQQKIVGQLFEGLSSNKNHETYGTAPSGWNPLANPHKTRGSNNYLPDFKKKIIVNLSKGSSLREIHKTYGISLSTLQRWKNSLHKKHLSKETFYFSKQSNQLFE